MRYSSFVILIFYGTLAAVTIFDNRQIAAAQPVDNTIYAELLGKYVINGKVSYNGLKEEESRLDMYLDHLSSVDTAKLTRNERFAFYINAYNAWTLKLILMHYPGIKSIKAAGTFFSSPWKKKIARINGEVTTLDTIEHDILRSEFKDPRVHFAINCAALSCPPLAGFPFNGDQLDRQLNIQTRKFINNSNSNYLKGHTLWVSRIFKWFAKDFDNDIIAFFLKYSQGDLKDRLSSDQNRITVKYLEYDWSLNDN